jgi:hypothetical protein
MATPAIIWRNPKPLSHRRLWNRARRDETSTLYIVVRSADRDSEWEGLPNLEMIEGGCNSAKRNVSRGALSRG